jgi:hypothetical protein
VLPFLAFELQINTVKIQRFAIQKKEHCRGRDKSRRTAEQRPVESTDQRHLGADRFGDQHEENSENLSTDHEANADQHGTQVKSGAQFFAGGAVVAWGSLSHGFTFVERSDK